jgi:arabinan endo-1,5-alpha-L-arabinosidase
MKITLSGAGRALSAGDNGQLSSVESFTGGDDQLWRIDQLVDGSYRIQSKGSAQALTAGPRNSLALAPFDANNNAQKWLILAP